MWEVHLVDSKLNPCGAKATMRSNGANATPIALRAGALLGLQLIDQRNHWGLLFRLGREIVRQHGRARAHAR
jgi:hypothetical protein